jgi:hypothetical protein
MNNNLNNVPFEIEIEKNLQSTRKTPEKNILELKIKKPIEELKQKKIEIVKNIEMQITSQKSLITYIKELDIIIMNLKNHNKELKKYNEEL